MARDAIKLLLEMDDVKQERLNWKKINRLIPPAKRHGPDRPPTADEIRKILLHVNLRLKCVILILVSSGMRVGSLSWLRWQELMNYLDGSIQGGTGTNIPNDKRIPIPRQVARRC